MFRGVENLHGYDATLLIEIEYDPRPHLLALADRGLGETETGNPS